MAKSLNIPIPLVIVAGARPNFMKVAPLMDVLSRDPDFAPILVHTGQHYDHNMSGQFFQDLGLPEAHYYLEAGSGSHAHKRPTSVSVSGSAVIVLDWSPCTGRPTLITTGSSPRF